MNGRWDEFKSGWMTILAAAAGAGVGMTGFAFYTFGLFVKPLSQTFGWSRGQIGLGLTWITIGTILCAPAVGWLTDRFGVRKVALPSLLGLGLAYALLSRVNGAIGSFYLGCFGVAFLGCATSPVTWTRAVSEVFQRSRGLALGVTLLGSASASLFGVPFLAGVIASHGWPSAYLTMAAITVLFAFPVVLIFLRGPGGKVRDPSAPPPAGVALAQAIKTWPFWIIGVGVMIMITAQSGTIVHLVPLLTDRGLTTVQAAGIAGVLGLSIFISRVCVGALLDRFNPAIVAGLVMLAPVVASAVLATCGRNPLLLTIAVLLEGLSSGAEIDFLSFFVARYFGIRAYGRIYGTLFAMFSMGNGLGAPLVGAAFDHWHSYVQALWIAGGLFLIGAAMFASLVFHAPLKEEAETIV
jgi:predicted MFS family arabinose efflux permease